MNDDNLVMYIVVNSDLKMGKGKIAAQVGHVVQYLIKALEKINQIHLDDYQLIHDIYLKWIKESHAKVVLKTDESTMLELINKYKLPGSFFCLQVLDAGRTQVPENSLTVIGFSPIWKSEAPDDIKNLKLL